MISSVEYLALLPRRCSVLAARLSRSGSSRGCRRLLIFFEPRENLVGEQRQVLDRVGVRHGARMAHHQEISHPAAILAKIDDLIVDLRRRAAEQNGGIYQFLYARAAHIDDASILGVAARRRFPTHKPRVVGG